MSLIKYVFITSVLLLQTSLCFARSENSINIFLLPDPITNCSTAGVEIAITKNSTFNH